MVLDLRRVGVTPQRGGDLAIVHPQRQEAAVVIGGIAERGRVPFKPHPLGLERGFGYAQHQHARPLQSLLDRRDDVLATVDVRAVKPHAKARTLQPLGQPSDSWLIDAAVRQKHIPVKRCAHRTVLCEVLNSPNSVGERGTIWQFVPRLTTRR